MTTNKLTVGFSGPAGTAWGFVREDKTGQVMAAIQFSRAGNSEMLESPTWIWDGPTNTVANARRAMIAAAARRGLSR